MIKEKECNRCREIKSIDDFRLMIRKNRPNNGYSPSCKECEKLFSRQYYNSHLKQVLDYAKKYRTSNPEQIKDNNIKNHKKRMNDPVMKAYFYEGIRKYRINNRDKVLESKKKHFEKYKREPAYRLNRSMSGGMCMSLKQNKKGRHWESLINYTLKDLIEYLESLFKDGMSWDNYGKWHVDHIIPKSVWKFKNSEDSEFKQCWALANLQPLWARDNLIKHVKVV